MSTYQAVATVTAALRERLLETVMVDVPSATVTTLRPADPGTNGIPTVGVNLFLFAVHISAAHRNRDLPLRSPSGDTRQVPVIPLELDYLISFYGDANGAAHQLVGSVMRSLYARPILTAAMIQAVEGGTSGLNSGLAGQADPVRFTPLTLPIEEIAKLWTVFFQSSYALSVAFRAAPIMVEADQPLTIAAPVATPQVAAFSLAPPVITSVGVQGAPAGTPITAGSTVLVSGTGFDPATAQLIIAGNPVAPTAATAGALAAPLPTTLSAGGTTLQVQQGVSIGSPPVARFGPASAVVTFLLQPVVTQTGGAYAISVSNETGTGSAPRSATITIGITPVVATTQTVSLALLDLTGATQYVFRAPDLSAAATSIAFAVSHDRYANIEVSYLLQRMEQHRGLAILTTNMKDAIDTAFLRRIRFVVEFTHPGPAERQALWQRAFPPAAPLDGIDPARLAQANFTGAQIHNVALAAAFLAADAGEPIRMAHCLAAAQHECIKLQRPPTRAEAAGWT